jgi:RND superfamily putative drug exporter
MAPRVTDRLLSGLGKAPTEAREAAHLLRDELGAPQTGVAFAISHPTLTVDDQEYEDSLAAALAPLSDSPDVKAVQSYYSTGNRHMVSGDGRTTYVNVMIDADPRLLIAGFSEFRDPVQSDVLDIKATGGLAIFADVNRSSERDLRRAEIITFPIVLLALIFVFRSVFAATLPLVMGGVAVGITLASIYLLAGVMDMSVFVLNVASFLGLGAAIDYLLVLVSRFREERSTLSPHDAIGRTMATAGRAIMLSAITSMLGLSGLLFFDYMMLRSLGVGGIIVIGVSVLTALTLLPALLSLLGDRLGTGQAGIGGERMWGRLASWVMRHPLAVLIIVGGFLIALGIPFLNVNVGSPWADILPPKAEARQGWTIIANEIGPSELAPILVVAIPDDGEVGLEDAPALLDLLLDIQKDPDVQRAEISTLAITGGAPISLSALSRAVASGNLPESLPIAVVRVYSRFGPADAETEALVKRLRRVQEPGGIDLLVGGGTADLNDAVDQMYGTFPWVIAYTMVAVYLVTIPKLSAGGIA